MLEFAKKLFAAIIASLAAPICGGVISLFAGTYIDASLSGLMSFAIALLVGVIPAAFGAFFQAPLPYPAVVFILIALPLFMLLWSCRRLNAGSVLLVGILLGVVFSFLIDFFPVEARQYIPYIPREHPLLIDIWAYMTGISGAYLLWYVGFHSEEGYRDHK